MYTLYSHCIILNFQVLIIFIYLFIYSVSKEEKVIQLLLKKKNYVIIYIIYNT